MKNRIEYKEIKKNQDVFTILKNNFRAKSKDQGSDCWSSLWKRIKAQSYRFFRQSEKVG
ncbi:MAG: hypothetical protein NUV91_02835 [Candidatus Omnitrophica bacterium]|nr:hypothetical protein [Candidatus Omnitrophota bacterium]